MDTKTYAEAFAREYVGPIFYYCLKKTGDRGAAEELAADISLAVLHSLSKNPPPEHFSAWVWKIAKNRYARWCKGAAEHRARVAGEDIGEFDITDGDTPENTVIEKEQYSLLRRELAFTSREYRELIAAHYIDGIGISELAKRLGKPTGTVKTRLFKARKILKEGMDMAREFGKRSWAPEEVNFVASGSQANYPWSVVQRRIPKNILLEANDNPSTAEELAMELGIALPYMEEEIGILTESTLLKKLDNGKYITNFFIADKECQVEVYNALKKNSKRRFALLKSAIDECYDELKELIKPTVCENNFKWFLYLYTIGELVMNCKNFTLGNFRRPGGHNWGFMGYEQHELISEKCFVNYNNMPKVGKTVSFGQYAAVAYGFVPFDFGDFSPERVAFVGDILSSARKISELTSSERDMWDGLASRYVHRGDDGCAVADIVVLRGEAPRKMLDILRSSPAMRELDCQINDLFAEVREILRHCSNAVLHETLDYYVSTFMCDVRGMMINEAVEGAELMLPEKPSESNAGYYIVIE